jgi:CBS domain-containing protein
MDGGRVLRALLAMRMDYINATQAAATVGQAMAVLFGILGLMGNPILLFIALFVWLGAQQEAAVVQMRGAFSRVPVRRAMASQFRTLSPDEPIGRAVETALSGFQQDFPVVQDGRVVGVLTQPDLLAALAEHGPDSPVRDAMRRHFAVADPLEMLDGAITRLRDDGGRAMPVLSRGQLVGLLTAENVSELLMIRDALRRSRQA